MPIAAVGRKDPALAAALRGEAPLPAVVDYVVGRRPLKIGDEVRQPGDPVPEAAKWPRIESWINTGRLVAVPRTAETPEPKPEPVEPRSGAQHEKEMAEEPPAKKAAARPRSSSRGRAQRVRPRRPEPPEGTDAPVLRPPRRDG